MENYNTVDCGFRESWDWERFGQQAKAKEEERY
jgi:hypothetical protein